MGSNPCLAQGSTGSEGAGSWLCSSQGSGELAPCGQALLPIPKRKPVEKVVLIHPHCQRGHLYGKERTRWEGPGKPCFLPAHRSSGHLGLLSGARRERQLESDMLQHVRQRAWALESGPGHIILKPAVTVCDLGQVTR